MLLIQLQDHINSFHFFWTPVKVFKADNDYDTPTERQRKLQVMLAGWVQRPEGLLQDQPRVFLASQMMEIKYEPAGG